MKIYLRVSSNVMYKNPLKAYLARIKFSIPYPFMSKFGGSFASQCLFDFTLPITAYNTQIKRDLVAIAREFKS